MSQFTQEPLRFPPVDGRTVRADVDGGAMSSDFGPLILHGVDPPIGLTERLAQTVDDPRHPPYLAHRFWACPQVYETSGIAALLSRGE